MSIKFTGFDELQRDLKKLARNAQELQGNHNVPLDELITPSFMRNCSDFSSFDELLEAGGFEVNSKEDFEAIPDDVFDEHISKVTKYASWDKMLGAATDMYVTKKLGL